MDHFGLGDVSFLDPLLSLQRVKLDITSPSHVNPFYAPQLHNPRRTIRLIVS